MHDAPHEKLKNQLEFYFSDSNIHKSKYLKSLIAQSEDGGVPIEQVMSFNRIVAMNATKEDICIAVQSSDKLKISQDGSSILRIFPLNDFNAIDRTIYIERVTKEDVDSLREKFLLFGKVSHVSLPKFESGKPKGFAFIEFEQEEAAERMYKDDALPFRKIWKRDWLKLKEEYIEWQSFHQATREDVYIGTCEDYPIELSFEALKYIFGQFGEVIYINLLEKKLYVRFKLQSELDRAASNRIIEFPDTGTIVTSLKLGSTVEVKWKVPMDEERERRRANIKANKEKRMAKLLKRDNADEDEHRELREDKGLVKHEDEDVDIILTKKQQEERTNSSSFSTSMGSFEELIEEAAKKGYPFVNPDVFEPAMNTSPVPTKSLRNETRHILIIFSAVFTVLIIYLDFMLNFGGISLNHFLRSCILLAEENQYLTLTYLPPSIGNIVFLTVELIFLFIYSDPSKQTQIISIVKDYSIFVVTVYATIQIVGNTASFV